MFKKGLILRKFTFICLFCLCVGAAYFFKERFSKPTLSFYQTEDFNKNFGSEISFSSLMHALKNEGLENGKDFFFSFSHSFDDPAAALSAGKSAVKEVDIVVAMGDLAADVSSELLVSSQKTKVFIIASKLPKFFSPKSMTGVVIQNKSSAEELNKEVAKQLADLIRTKNIKEI